MSRVDREFVKRARLVLLLCVFCFAGAACCFITGFSSGNAGVGLLSAGIFLLLVLGEATYEAKLLHRFF
jgi:lipopolysaccharide export LptBFGC system permease protein LptF